MQENNTTSESHQKVEQFKNEIRSRQKNDYMRKIRYQFLSLEQSSNKTSASSNSLNDLSMLLSQQCNKTTVSKINKNLIEVKSNLTETVIYGLINYVKTNLISNSVEELLKKPELNDLIALFGNLLAIHNAVQLQFFIDFERALELMLSLIQSASIATGDLVLWILFQLSQINPTQIFEKLAPLQVHLKQKFTLSNLNLSYILCSMAEHHPQLLNPSIVEEYVAIKITNQTKKYFPENLIIIFNSFLKFNKNAAFVDRLISWASWLLSSAYVGADVKANLLRLLLNIVKNYITVTSIMNILGNPQLIYELMQRSMFDNYTQKTLTLATLNQILQSSPQLQLQQLVTNYPSITEVLVSSLSLMQHTILISSLISIGKIIALKPQDSMIKDMFIKAGLENQLEILRESKNQKVVIFVQAILNNYLQMRD